MKIMKSVWDAKYLIIMSLLTVDKTLKNEGLEKDRLKIIGIKLIVTSQLPAPEY